MPDLKTLDQSLNLYRAAGISALGQYAITCLIYADVTEQLENRKRFRTGPEGTSANEYLLFRIVDELVKHDFIDESFNIIPLIHRTQYSYSAWSIPMNYIIKNNLQAQYEQQFESMVDSLSAQNFISAMTLADFGSGFKQYQRGELWLEQVFDELQRSDVDLYQWERFAVILSSYPANDTTLSLALRAWEKIKDDIGMAKYYVGAFLALFEGESDAVDSILKNLPRQPSMGTSVSVNDLVMRNSARLWLKLENPPRAVQVVEKILDPNYKRYAEADLLKYVDELFQQGHGNKAEALLQAMGKSMDWYLSKIESEKKSTSEQEQTLSESESESLAQSLLEQAVIIGKRHNISKVEASEQIQILRRLLEINQLTAAWKVVDMLVETLEKVPAFSKHEFRAHDVSELLEPYHGHHPEILYKFTTELIRRDAKRGYWQTVHGISATLSLMIDLVGANPAQELSQFLSDWPNGEVDDYLPRTSSTP